MFLQNVLDAEWNQNRLCPPPHVEPPPVPPRLSCYATTNVIPCRKNKKRTRTVYIICLFRYNGRQAQLKMDSAGAIQLQQNARTILKL